MTIFRVGPVFSIGAYNTASADIDGDGDLDLLVSEYRGSNVSIVLNNGTAPPDAGRVRFHRRLPGGDHRW